MPLVITKMLALWLLLLIQMPNVFLSEGPFRGDGDVEKPTRKRKSKEFVSYSPKAKKSAGTIDEQPADHSETLLKQGPDALLEEAKCKLLREKLEEVEQRLGLQLLEKQEPSKSNGELLWDQNNIMVASRDEVFGELAYNRNITINLAGEGDEGKLLILPYEAGRAPLSFQLNQRRYFLVGGVAKVCDEASHLLHYMAFTVDSTGILSDRYGHISFAEKRYSPATETVYFGDTKVYLERESILPPHVSLYGDISHVLHYKHLIYQDMGPPKAPYSIQSLDLNLGYRAKTQLRKALGERGGLFDDTIDQGINLIQFMLFWKAFKSEDAFRNVPGLDTLSDKFQALRDGTIEKQQVVQEACEYIKDHSSDIDAVADKNDPDPDRFFKILMKKVPEIGNSFVAKLNDSLGPETTIEETVCDTLSDELVFYRNKNRQRERLPYQISILCNGRDATFRRVTGITMGGTLTVCGTDYHPHRDERIIQIATYDTKNSVKIQNLSFMETKDLSFGPREELVIYQYFDENSRFKKTKDIISSP